MLCENPWMVGIIPCPCGDCKPCRINRRRVWTARIMLEAKLHARNTFLTLTYDEEHYPNDGSLEPHQLRLFWAKLRKHYPARTFRYYAVGEYGDKSQRAHYHAALFGISPQDASILQTTWGKGFIYCGELTIQSAQYVAGYVVKKLCKRSHPDLNGRYPEFSRMSNKPGIAGQFRDYMWDSLWSKNTGEIWLDPNGDVPKTVTLDGKQFPLGRLITRGLREKASIQEVSQETYKAQMQALWLHSYSSSSEKPLSVKQAILEEYAGRRAHVIQAFDNYDQQKGNIL